MKLIDLFKLMLERKAPKKIKFLGMTMIFVETAEWGDYLEVDGIQKLSNCRLIDCLNEYVEMIDDQSEKIEPLGKERLCLNFPGISDFDRPVRRMVNENRDKINEVIDKLNNLLENGDKE